MYRKSQKPQRTSAESLRGQVLSLVDGYFSRHGRPRRGSKILVAVSGGPDSVALLGILSVMSESNQWTLGVAHVNHGLRGVEADADMEFVRALTKRLRLQFHGRRLNPDRRSPKMNLQVWARTQRYDFFERVASRFGYAHIALGHQLNDRAETVAAAVLDAGGTFALSGIPPARGRIIRPLFDVPRQMIEGFLTEAGFVCRQDSSNLSRHYQRNRIRLDVLPQWELENPGIVPGLARLGEQVWQQQRFLEAKAERLLKQAIKGTNRGALELDARRLGRYDAALDPHVLRLLVDRIGLDIVPRPMTVTRFGQLRRQKAGSGTVEQGGLVITRSQQTMRVATRKAVTEVESDSTQVPGMPRLETRVVDLPKLRRSDDRLVARFDFNAVVGELGVRWPRRGDRYQPLGLDGTKKLSDLFADRKVPLFDRGLVPLVVDHQGILWPVGHPIAHRARLTNRTRRVLEARLKEESWKSRS